MVGCVTGCGVPTPFQGLAYSSWYGVRDTRRGTRDGGYVMGDTPTPETGLGYPFPVSILPWYGRLCLHQPLSGVDRSHHVSLSPYVIGGYAYINPLAGLIPYITCRGLLCYGGLCLHQPLSGVGTPTSRVVAYYVIGGYAYVNPLAGLIPYITRRSPPWYGGLCLRQPLSGVEGGQSRI